MKKSKITLPTSKDLTRSTKASKKYLKSVGQWEEYGKFWRKEAKDNVRKEKESKQGSS